MDNILQHENKMTIFYSKKDGSIKGIATGVQDISFYGDNAEDFRVIRDCIVIDKDMDVFNNFKRFVVNTETKEVELLEEYVFQPEKYKIAKTKKQLIGEGLKDENYKTI